MYLCLAWPPVAIPAMRLFWGQTPYWVINAFQALYRQPYHYIDKNWGLLTRWNHSVLSECLLMLQAGDLDSTVFLAEAMREVSLYLTEFGSSADMCDHGLAQVVYVNTLIPYCAQQGRND